jgi:single-stranded DNA-binding protein
MIVIGRLSENPILKTYNSGKEYAVFSLVQTVIENGNAVAKKTTFVSQGKQASLVMKHLSKGDLCCIEGYPFRNESQPNNCQILCDKITFLNSKKTA